MKENNYQTLKHVQKCEFAYHFGNSKDPHKIPINTFYI